MNVGAIGVPSMYNYCMLMSTPKSDATAVSETLDNDNDEALKEQEKKLTWISQSMEKAFQEQSSIVNRVGEIEEFSFDGLSEDRNLLGMTSYPVSSVKSNIVVAYEAEESTEENPIVQVTLNDPNGEEKTFDIYINEINPLSATDMEMFAFLSYQDSIGNNVEGAINSWAAYRTIQRENDWDSFENMDLTNGYEDFVEKEYNAYAIAADVYSWSKEIQHPDAKKQVMWSNQLLNTFDASEGIKLALKGNLNGEGNIIGTLRHSHGQFYFDLDALKNISMEQKPSFAKDVFDIEGMQKYVDDIVKSNEYKKKSLREVMLENEPGCTKAMYSFWDDPNKLYTFEEFIKEMDRRDGKN